MSRSVVSRTLRAWPALPWLWALGPSLVWTARTLSRPEHHANALILGAGGAIVALRYTRGQRLGPITPRALPLLVATLGLLSFLWLERHVDISLLSASAAFFTLYGLLGLFVSPGRWRRARAGLLLAIAALPLAEQAHHYAGFALRLLTAKVVAAQLSDLGLAPVTSETVLVLERGVTHVEAACSGLKSVWAASLLLLGAAFMQRQAAGPRLLAAAVVQCILLFLGNIIRITAIVTLTYHFQQPGVANLVHEPLGILAFITAAAAGLAVLGRRGPQHRRQRTSLNYRFVVPRQAFAILLAGIGVVGGLMYEARPHAPRHQEGFAAPLGPELGPKTLPLSGGEQGLFRQQGVRMASKHVIRSGALAATVVLVAADSWRAHHPPALCLAGDGHRLDAPRPVQFGPELRAQYSTTNGQQRTAVHWFQSKSATTPALLDRIRDGVFGAPQTWVMVSVLIHQPLEADDPRLNELLQSLHTSVDRALEASS